VVDVVHYLHIVVIDDLVDVIFDVIVVDVVVHHLHIVVVDDLVDVIFDIVVVDDMVEIHQSSQKSPHHHQRSHIRNCHQTLRKYGLQHT